MNIETITPTPIFHFHFAGRDGYVTHALTNRLLELYHYDGGEPQEVKKAPKAMRYAIEKGRMQALDLDINTFRFYDNQRYQDRYTVLYMDTPIKDNFEALAIDLAGHSRIITSRPGYHLGLRVWLSDFSNEAKCAFFKDLDLDEDQDVRIIAGLVPL